MIADHLLSKKKGQTLTRVAHSQKGGKRNQGPLSPSLYGLPRSLLWHGFKNHPELNHELALVSWKCVSSSAYCSQGRRAINSSWYLVSANQYSSISWRDKCLGPRAPGCYSCKNSATITWMQRSAGAAQQVHTSPKLGRVPQNKKPQLSTIASGPLPTTTGPLGAMAPIYGTQQRKLCSKI